MSFVILMLKDGIMQSMHCFIFILFIASIFIATNCVNYMIPSLGICLMILHFWKCSLPYFNEYNLFYIFYSISNIQLTSTHMKVLFSFSHKKNYIYIFYILKKSGKRKDLSFFQKCYNKLLRLKEKNQEWKIYTPAMNYEVYKQKFM